MKSGTQIKEPLRSYPLCGLNSWKVGGEADFFCEPKNQEEIFYYLQWAKTKNLPVTFLSGGTNVLISDQGVEGLVMSLRKLDTCSVQEKDGRLFISALAGVSKAKIMQVFLKHKLAPALFLCGLPGDVGGGVVMNAGVGFSISPPDFHSQNLGEEASPYTTDNSLKVFCSAKAKNHSVMKAKIAINSPREFKDIVDWVKVIREDKVVLISGKNLKWKYRFSQGWAPGLIYEVGMSWPIEPFLDLPAWLKEMALRRARSQPLKFASCGSVFKNPLTGEKSGALIEQCGLKGYEIGQACISKKHANFILNKGGAKAMDIHLLIQHIQKTVRNTYNIFLEPEVKYMGRWPINNKKPFFMHF